MFPANAAGFALVILRCCVALQLVLAFPALISGLPLAPKAILVCATVIALCIGALTPAGCLITMLLQTSMLQSDRGAGWQLVVPLALPIAVFLLGPGAYSVDAKRYGRRVINGPAK
jgi:putative oxidoreductase